ncbi:hypothetical protein D0T84_17845 [Dysgonomonas sp. 521]|uniref:E2/UBC family protein n=1 Tax=Dysgonomonas sp. 521 TaxID=2302932 RepID=UPI0013D126AD|nr:E2/UBC family protein [Dysgonomonas sp. 521]NDV96758.1 hypothetical protein [Dysgonomonas sp. 521]
MHDLTGILTPCFEQLYKIEDVRRVDEIPDIRTDYYAEQWKVITEIDVNDQVKEIELYLGFLKSFPYTLPDIYFPNKAFGYLPHVESVGGKLCLMPDGASYPIDNPYEVIRYCLKQSKKLIEQGVKNENVDDFKAEINSYWRRMYDGEPETSDYWLIYENFPVETCVLKTLLYSQNVLGKKKPKTITRAFLLPKDYEESNIERYLKYHHKAMETEALFVKSVIVPDKASYSLTLQKLLECTSSAEDRRAIKSFINAAYGGIIVFQLSETTMGGIYIDKVNTKKKGFRTDKLTACDFLLRFEKKNLLLERQYGSLYSSHRIAMRTAGTEMPKQSFVITGLGSVGSNLTYFLSGWNNASFTLIDAETLQPENIGRHLLGFHYIYQNKVDAVADYLYSIRPERGVNTYNDTFQNIVINNSEVINTQTALFLCTGDAMTEKFIIDTLRNGHIKIPTFILWLEPFGIAGHLVYINPEQIPESFNLYNNEERMLYKHNLLEPTEYIAHADRFTKRDAGCNGEYSLYSGNDVTLLLSALYPHINQLIQQPQQSKCYRWVGNIHIAIEKNIKLTVDPTLINLGEVQELNL